MDTIEEGVRRLANNKKVYKVSVTNNNTETILEHYFESYSSACRYAQQLIIFCGQNFLKAKIEPVSNEKNNLRFVYIDETSCKEIRILFDEVTVDAYDSELNDSVKDLILGK